MVARTDIPDRSLTDAVEAPMEFRWIAVLALWTLLSGPILSQPSPQPPTAGQWTAGATPVLPDHSSHHPATRR